MGTRPWEGKIGAGTAPDCPASYVNYEDCREFIARLNACGGGRYRLPTSSEWLHAARAGTPFLFGFDHKDEPAAEHAWCLIKRRDKDGILVKDYPTTPTRVGTLRPNPLGFLNMPGNVREWTSEWYDYWYWNAKRNGAVRTDPPGPESGKMRVLCGGHFRYHPNEIYRYPAGQRKPHRRLWGVGFRLCRDAD